jgi:hypothetical protein
MEIFAGSNRSWGFFVDTFDIFKINRTRFEISADFRSSYGLCMFQFAKNNRSIHAYLFSSPGEKTTTVRNFKTIPSITILKGLCCL